MSERWFPDTMPPPMVDADTAAWWQATAEHRLTVQRCGDCAVPRHPPAPICPACRGSAIDWQDLAGTGSVYTFTIVHRAVSPDQSLPFVIAAIELDGGDGIRMISNLVDVDPAAIAIGMAVELVWEDMGPELVVPRFRPASV